MHGQIFQLNVNYQPEHQAEKQNRNRRAATDAHRFRNVTSDSQAAWRPHARARGETAGAQARTDDTIRELISGDASRGKVRH